MFKPAEKNRLLATRLLSIVIGLAPIPFALYVPGLLKTIFFARALRTTISVIVVFMFYMPMMGSSRSAFWGLILGSLGVVTWFFLGNPFGIDNIYIGVAIPALVMLGHGLFSRGGRKKRGSGHTRSLARRLGLGATKPVYASNDPQGAHTQASVACVGHPRFSPHGMECSFPPEGNLFKRSSTAPHNEQNVVWATRQITGISGATMSGNIQHPHWRESEGYSEDAIRRAADDVLRMGSGRKYHRSIENRWGLRADMQGFGLGQRQSRNLLPALTE